MKASVMDRKKLISYIQGRLHSKQDLNDVLDWIEASPGNQEEYNELKRLWVLSGFSSKQQLDLEKSLEQGKRNRFRFSLLLPSYRKYAAVFFISFIIGAASVYLFLERNSFEKKQYFNEVYVPEGEKSMVTLSDGTIVWLNSGSKLTYPSFFGNDKREVSIEGEAYFDVAENKAKPFIARTGSIRVRVLGTHFNLYDYPEDSIVHATLEKGAIEVTIGDNTNTIKIKPGQQFLYALADKKYELKEVDTELYTSWIDNVLRFENAKLVEILKKMERWYGVKIKMEEGLNLNEHFTISIKTESLKEILEMLAITTDLDYEIEGDIVRISKK